MRVAARATAIPTIEAGNSSVVTGALSIDFNSNEFNVTDDGGTEGDITIDFTNSGITRSSSTTETIKGTWTFYNTLTVPAITATSGTSTFQFASTSAFRLGTDYLTDQAIPSRHKIALHDLEDEIDIAKDDED